MQIGGNVQAGRDAQIAERDLTVTQMPETISPAIQAKIQEVRSLLNSQKAVEPSHVRQLFDEICDHAPMAAAELFDAFRRPLIALGIWQRF